MLSLKETKFPNNGDVALPAPLEANTPYFMPNPSNHIAWSLWKHTSRSLDRMRWLIQKGSEGSGERSVPVGWRKNEPPQGSCDGGWKKRLGGWIS